MYALSTRTRLANAMRDGAKLRPQVRWDYFARVKPDDQNSAVGSCALGAAWEGLGNIVTDDMIFINKTLGPDIKDIAMRFRVSLKYADMIATLNDYGHSREQIADYIEEDTLEKKFDSMCIGLINSGVM